LNVLSLEISFLSKGRDPLIMATLTIFTKLIFK
jgi:hypothetical protein